MALYLCVEKTYHLLRVILHWAPITPRDVRRRYSNVALLEVVFEKGNRKSKIWACKNKFLVSRCDATPVTRPRALHTRFDNWSGSLVGSKNGYTDMISFSKAVMTPKEDHRTTARSPNCSTFAAEFQ